MVGFGTERSWQVSSFAVRLYLGCDSLIRELEQLLLKVFAGRAERGLSCFDYPYVCAPALTNEQSGLPLRGTRRFRKCARGECWCKQQLSSK